MKRMLLVIMICMSCLGLGGCGINRNSEKNTISCSESDYLWEDDIIIGLTEEGATKSELCIPERCKGFGNMVFSNADNVKKVTFESDQDIDLGGGFGMADRLSEIDLPAHLTTIPAYAFWGCESLTTMIIPEGVLTIEEGAFSNATGLKKVVFNGAVTEIRKSAFEGCTSLETLKIPDTVEVIGEYAFAKCESIKKIRLPEGLKEAGTGVFYGCSHLKRIIVPESLQLEDYTSTSLAQISIITLSKDAPVVKVVKRSWMDQNYDSVFGRFRKKYY